MLYYSQNEITRTFIIKNQVIFIFKTITQNIHVLYTKLRSAVVFSATDFHDNPPHVMGFHYIACSATENTPYHGGDWKTTTTIYNGKCKKKNMLCPLYLVAFSFIGGGNRRPEETTCLLYTFTLSWRTDKMRRCSWNVVYAMLQVTILKTKQKHTKHISIYKK